MASNANPSASASAPTSDAQPSAAFTPGPLAVWSSLYEAFGARVVVKDSDPLRTLAEVRKYRDAVLYAAAPDLYEALKSLRDALAQNPAMQGREYVGLGIQVNNALAKAEGRS